MLPGFLFFCLTHLCFGITSVINLPKTSSHEISVYSVKRSGIHRLDWSSDLLKPFSQSQGNLSSIFSFSFKDKENNEGENWFSLGGYAGLDPAEIHWVPQTVGLENDNRTSSAYNGDGISDAITSSL
jgi:hypothetical protein